MSRRAAEREIESGNVTVNGITANIGDRIDPIADTVRWKGNVIAPEKAGYTYIALNKPLGYVTTMSDEQSRKTVADLVCDVGTRVYPVGRLDMYSEGLIILTDDGDLANKLTHPSNDFSKRYIVKVKGVCTEDHIKKLLSPMELDNYQLRPIKAKLLKSGETDREGNIYSTIAITLFEGRNRQIRRMCEKCDLTVMRLRRISVGNVKLNDLPLGKWRHLTNEEIKELKEKT